MSLHPIPSDKLSENDFTGVDEIPADGAAAGGYDQILGYNSFKAYCRCDRQAIVQIQLSEDHDDWHTLQDKEWTDVLSEHSNGTVGVAAVTITPTTQMHDVMIHNTHALQNILVSFDAGGTWKTLTPDRSISVPDNSFDYQIVGSAAGTTYETIATVFLWGVMVYAGANKSFVFDAAGARYYRVVVTNLDTVNALAAEIPIKCME